MAVREMTPSDELRFWLKVGETTSMGCWPWTAGHFTNGYAEFFVAGWDLRAHRVAYELEVGPIPAGLELDHLCRNRGCVNPDHLEPVTQQENMARGEGIGVKNARKTHCPAGHEFTPENTIMRSDTGARRCRMCLREQRRKYRPRKRETKP